MSAAMQSIVEEVRWVIAMLACLLMAVLGTFAGFALTAIVVIWLYGSDDDGWMNVFFLGPLGALIGLSIGILVGSEFISWARASEAYR